MHVERARFWCDRPVVPAQPLEKLQSFLTARKPEQFIQRPLDVADILGPAGDNRIHYRFVDCDRLRVKLNDLPCQIDDRPLVGQVVSDHHILNPFDPIFVDAWLPSRFLCHMLPSKCYDVTLLQALNNLGLNMEKFGDRIRELRNAKGYSLRQLAPLVGVGFSYLSKVECGRLDFNGTASESLIHRLAEVLEADEDELLLLAGRIPDSIADRIREQPEVFRVLAKCDAERLSQFAANLVRHHDAR